MPWRPLRRDEIFLPMPAEAHLSAIADLVATPRLTFRASGTGKTISIWLRGPWGTPDRTWLFFVLQDAAEWDSRLLGDGSFEGGSRDIGGRGSLVVLGTTYIGCCNNEGFCSCSTSCKRWWASGCMLGKGVDGRKYRRLMIRMMRRKVIVEQTAMIITASLDNIEIEKEKNK